MKNWAYELDAKVSLKLSGETGHVVARSEALDYPDQFRVRYVAADGRQVEDWFFEGAIQPEAKEG